MAKKTATIYDEGDSFGSPMSHTGATSCNGEDEATLLESLERRLLRPDVRCDPAKGNTLLAHDFREFGSSGKIFTRDAILQALAVEAPAEIVMEHFAAVRLSADVYLVTYRSSRVLPAGERREALRSSIWKREAGSWQVIFHQGTPVPNGKEDR